MTQLRFAPIIRVSTEKQREKIRASLDHQTNKIERYVKQLGGVVPKWYKGQESAMPGRDRVIFNQLLEDSEKGLFDAVIVTNVDRFSRDNGVANACIERWKELGIKFYEGTSELDLYHPGQEKYVKESALAGEYVVKRNALDSMNVRIEKAEAGYPSSNASWPFGRIWNPETEKWTVDRKKKKQIEGAARRYIKGDETIENIARSIRVSRASLYRTLYLNSGPIWIQNFNSKLLNIHAEVPTEVGELLDAKTREAVHFRKNMNKTKHGEQKNFYALTKFIWCEHCGSRLFGNPVGKYLYYNHKSEDKPNCAHTKGIRKEELDNAVLVHLIRTFGDVELIEKAVKKAHPDSTERDRLIDERAEVGETERKYNQREQNIISAIGEGIITKENARKQLREIELGVESCQNSLAQIKLELEAMPDPKKVEEVARKAQRAFKALSSALEDPSRIARMKYPTKRKLIEHAFNGVDSVGKPLGVTVQWNDLGKYSIRISCNLGENVLNWGQITMLNREVEPGEYTPIEEDFGEQMTNLSGKYQ